MYALHTYLDTLEKRHHTSFFFLILVRNPQRLPEPG